MTLERWTLVPNPAHKPAGNPTPACHDRSRFMTIQCRCGNAMHVHETQLARPTADGLVVVICKPAIGGCGEILEIDLAYLWNAIDEAWA